jgi:CRISPR-associated endonuclease/helicase Cas3
MTVLNSHRFEQLNQPVYYLPLAGHLAQVGQAARSIWARHSARLREHCAEAWRWVEDSVQLHDTGKASAAFQQYIADPANYPGTRLSKAHTPLSMACVLYHGEANYWDWKRRLAVAQIAAGHHSAFKTLDELERVVNTNDIQAVLGDQLRSLDWDALDTAVGVTIARLPVSAGKVCAKVLDELEELAEEGLGNCPDKLRYRMLCQLAYSVLLEADKAFLAVASADLQRYLTDQAPVLPSCTVDTFSPRRGPCACGNGWPAKAFLPAS